MEIKKRAEVFTAKIHGQAGECWARVTHKPNRSILAMNATFQNGYSYAISVNVFPDVSDEEIENRLTAHVAKAISQNTLLGSGA